MTTLGLIKNTRKFVVFVDIRAQISSINAYCIHLSGPVIMQKTDIGEPPSGNISPFSIYVALSRGRGRDNQVAEGF